MYATGRLALGIAVAAGFCSVVAGDEPMRIDAHIHLYDTSRPEGVPWPPRHVAALFSPHRIDDFRAVRQGTMITHAIVVEASDRASDNDWLLQHVVACPDILGIIGSLDPRHEDFEEDLLRLSRNPKFLGIRPRFHPAPSLRDPGVAANLVRLADLGLTLEFNVPMYPLADVAAFAAANPSLRIVVNHLAGVRLVDGTLPPARSAGLEPFRELTNVYCKLSAFYHASGRTPAPTNAATYSVLLDRLVEVFGPERVFFGSNWPVSKLGGSYAPLPAILATWTAGREDLMENALFRTNTLRAYGLDGTLGE